MEMTDLVLLGVFVLALLWGWRLGAIRVLAGLGALVIAYQLARSGSALWAAQLTSLLPQLEPGSKEGQLVALVSVFVNTDALADRLLQLLLFIVIFVVVRWAIRKLAFMLTSLFGRGLFGSVNRAIGAFLSLLLAAVLLVILNSIVLPACVKMGLPYAATVLTFLQQSKSLLPLLYSAPQLLGR